MLSVTPVLDSMNPSLHIAPIPAFDDNYVWLLHDGRDAVVVDPGDAVPVLATLAELNLSLRAILITHHHGDHTGGVRALLEQGAVPVYGPQAEKISTLTHRLSAGDSLDLAALGQFTVLELPGHTAGHIAFYDAAAGVLFSGDVLFSVGCGRLFEGTAAQLFSSLQQLCALPGATRVYCTHEYTMANLRFSASAEPRNVSRDAYAAWCIEQREQGLPTVPTTIARELAVNPFLRCAQPGVIAAATEFAGRPCDGELAVFTALREWKNGFR
jgi:hydroxyacylglutathione hydrolase